MSFLCFPFNGNSIPIIPHCGLFYLEVQYVQELFLMNATPNIQYQTFFAESYRSCTPAKHLVTCVLLYCSDNLIGGSGVDIYDKNKRISTDFFRCIKCFEILDGFMECVFICNIFVTFFYLDF